MENWKKVLARNLDKYFTKVDDGLYASLSERESLLCSNNSSKDKTIQQKIRYLCP